MTMQEAVRRKDVLTPEAMLAASRARTGLSDFGDPGFREGLDLLLEDIRALDLDPVSVQTSAWRIGQSLDTRAMAVQGLKDRPELLAAPIREPITPPIRSRATTPEGRMKKLCGRTRPMLIPPLQRPCSGRARDPLDGVASARTRPEPPP